MNRERRTSFEKENKGTHRETTKFWFFVCESRKTEGEKLVERFNPNEEEKVSSFCVDFFFLLISEDKTSQEQEKRSRKEINSTKHTGCNDKNEKFFFWSFLNRYKK